MKDIKNVNEVVSGAFWLSVSAIILKLIGLIFKIPLSYMLGDEGMGYFNSAYTIYTAFYIIGSAGIPKAISILTVRADSNKEDSSAIFKVSFRCFCIIGAILTAVLLIFASQLSQIIGNSKSAYSLLVIAPSVFFVCASGVLRGALNGKMRFIPIAVSEIIAGAFKLCLGLLMAKYALIQAYSIEVVSAFAILGITVGSLFCSLYLFLSYSKIKNDKICTQYSYKKILKRVFEISIPITMVSAISSILNLLDLAVIMNGLKKLGYSESVSSVLYGNYTTLAIPMFSLVVTLVTPFSTAALPMMTKFYHDGDSDSLGNLINRTLSMTYFFTIPAFFAFLFFSEEILTIIFEKSSVILGYQLLSILAASVLFVGPLTVINTALESMGKVKITLLALSVGGVLKLILTLILINKFDAGIISAPIGTSISYAISFLVSGFIILNIKNIKISLIKTALVPFFASFMSVLVIVALREKFFGHFASFFNSFVIVTFFGIFYLFLSAFLHKIFAIKANKMAKCTKNTKNNY